MLSSSLHTPTTIQLNSLSFLIPTRFKQLLLTFVFLCAPFSPSFAAGLDIGDNIRNTAQVSFEYQNKTIITPSNEVLVEKTIKRTPATLNFFRGAGNASLTGSCSNQQYNSQVSQQQDLLSGDNYYGNETIYFKLDDRDQNINPNIKETVTVVLQSQKNGQIYDAESIIAYETGVNTGVFVGGVPSTRHTSVDNNCELSTASDETLIGIYVDTADPDLSSGQTSAISNALIDPLGTVFDSTNGNIIDGVQVSIYNAQADGSKGSPADVFYDTNASISWPSRVTAGSKVCYGNGSTCEQLDPGKFWFPFIRPGRYVIEVITGSDYIFGPSSASQGQLNTSFPQYTIINGSYEQIIEVLAPASGVIPPPIVIDIPKDPAIDKGGLVINKTTSAKYVGMGELVPYTIEILNASNYPNLSIVDTLPRGFRYIEGSAKTEQLGKVNDVNVTQNNQQIEFIIGQTLGNETITLKYVAQVSVDAVDGEAINQAYALDKIEGKRSNNAYAKVHVQDDLYRYTNQIIGKVFINNCHQDPNEKEFLVDEKSDVDLSDIRIFMQSGRYALTDKQGKFHLDNINNGSHIVQLDVDSIPEGYEVADCVKNTRHAGRPFSQFVDVQGGALWRTNFYIKEQANSKTDDIEKNTKQAVEETNTISEKTNTPIVRDQNWFDKQTSGFEFIEPSKDYASLGFTNISILHPTSNKVKVYLNNEEVFSGFFKKMKKNASGTMGISQWAGVHIKEGDNTLIANLIDDSGAVINSVQAKLHYSSEITHVTLVEEKSRLVADGRTPPIIAVRFSNKGGKPAHKDLQGKFSVDSPYRASTKKDRQLRNNLLLDNEIEPTYRISYDGIAYIELEPTTQAGKVTLNFPISDKTKQVQTWLKPEFRNWILVGLAEGTVTDSKIRKHMKNLSESEAKESYHKDGKVAFYAKGKIKGEYLLTIAYDSSKSGKKLAAEESIDPDAFFTLYGDRSSQFQDGSSSKKLYLRIENSQAYALFGDYDTALNKTELSNYTRKLTGIKSSGSFDKFAYTVFAAREESEHVREEINADGTSGPYRLKDNDILLNSESIKLEVRDRRNQSVVLESTQLSRYIDYDIDYFDRSITFKSNINNTDASFNPIVIVVDYETETLKEGEVTAGGRVEYNHKNIEAGITAVQERKQENQRTLKVGADAKIKLNDNNTVWVEGAKTRKKVTGQSAHAYLFRYEYSQDDTLVNASYKKEQAGFDINQQGSTVGNGTEQYRLDAKHKLNDKVYTTALVERQKTIDTDKPQTLDRAKTTLAYQHDNGNIAFGYEKSRFDNGSEIKTDDLISLAISQRLFDRLNSYASYERALNKNESGKHDQRYKVGLDYKINSKVSVFGSHELTDTGEGKSTRRQVGIRSHLWKGAQFDTALNNEVSNEGDKNFVNYTFSQQVDLNKQSNVRFSFEQGKGLDKDEIPFEGLNATEKEDYTSASAQYNLAKNHWHLSQQVEYRDTEKSNGDNSKRIGSMTRWYRELDDNGIGYGFRVNAYKTDNTGSNNYQERDVESELSYVYRPADSRVTVLERFIYDYHDNDHAENEENTRKLINHLRLNYQPDLNDQLSAGYSVKSVRQNVSDVSDSNTFHFVSGEYRHDINDKWDVGLRASAVHDTQRNATKYSYGPNIGFSPFTNAWLSVGYNVNGFQEDDFSEYDVNDKGFYLDFRMKLDQNSFRFFKNKSNKE